LITTLPFSAIAASLVTVVAVVAARVSAIAATVAIALAAAAAAAAGPPGAGVLMPGTSLGGVRLGMTLGQVEAAWGRAYGRCRSCERPTLYFNMYAHQPEGAGVELRRGRVAAVFTLWGPRAWHTADGVRIGDGVASVTATYGPMRRTSCRGYYALTLDSRPGRTAVYVVDNEVWGFGLLARGVPVCR
jgi:hypothetical protein